MSTLHSFSQGELLDRTTTDPEIRQGVCAALCAYWLSRMKVDSDNAPEHRLRMLENQIWPIIRQQQQYGRERRQHGRNAAQRNLGARQGLNYDPDQTVIAAIPPNLDAVAGMANLKQRFKADISRPGKATAWSLRFADGGGHAIAGFCNLTPIPNGFRYQLHVFDPNIGEYVGTLQEIDAMLDNLFRRPCYQKLQIVEAHRILVGIF
ncbi:MAG: YopT-type cysteine protease domain-containing protein [Candidatus Competibacteraceae bacterium]